MLTFLSILGIILSFLLIANPSVAGLSLVALTATVFILSGISSIALSISLKKLKDAPEKISKDLKDRLDLIEKELDQQASKKWVNIKEWLLSFIQIDLLAEGQFV